MVALNPVLRRACAACGLLLACFVLAAPAPVPVTVRDRFNNNVINTNLWELHQSGGVFLNEQNHRLEVRANGHTGARSSASLDVRPWGIDWRYPASISADYNLNLSAPPGNRIGAVGFGFSLTGSFPTTFTGLTAGVQREHTGLYLVIGRYQDGQVVGVQRTAISDTSGQLLVQWSRSLDRMLVTAGGTSLALTGLWATYGATDGTHPMVISIGGVTFNGDLTFTGAHAWLDDFEFVGVKRPR